LVYDRLSPRPPVFQGGRGPEVRPVIRPLLACPRRVSMAAFNGWSDTVTDTTTAVGDIPAPPIHLWSLKISYFNVKQQQNEGQTMA